MRNIPQAIIDALDAGVFRPLFLVEILFDTPLRFSNLMDDIVVGGKTYKGAGNLGSLSSHTENTDLDPQQIQAMVSGIRDENLSAVGGSNYINRNCTVLIGMMDDQGNLIGNATMVYFKGKSDEVKFTYSKQSQIIITIRDRLSDWGRQKLERNMNSDHQAKYPGDKFFEFVSQMSDKKIIWPKGEFFE